MPIRRAIARTWTIYLHLTAFGVIAFGLAAALVWALAGSGPVIEVKAVRNISTQVPYKGDLYYDIDSTRLESCPGLVVSSMRSITNHGPPAVVTWQRPVNSVEIGESLNAHVVIELSEAVFPGRWMYQASVDSRCPTYEQTDPIAHFEVEVLPQ